MTDKLFLKMISQEIEIILGCEGGHSIQLKSSSIIDIYSFQSCDEHLYNSYVALCIQSSTFPCSSSNENGPMISTELIATEAVQHGELYDFSMTSTRRVSRTLINTVLGIDTATHIEMTFITESYIMNSVWVMSKLVHSSFVHCYTCIHDWRCKC